MTMPSTDPPAFSGIETWDLMPWAMQNCLSFSASGGKSSQAVKRYFHPAAKLPDSTRVRDHQQPFSKQTARNPEPRRNGSQCGNYLGTELRERAAVVAQHIHEHFHAFVDLLVDSVRWQVDKSCRQVGQQPLKPQAFL